MVAFIDRNFLVAFIPTNRRDVHLKKYGPKLRFKRLSCLTTQYYLQIVIPGL